MINIKIQTTEQFMSMISPTMVKKITELKEAWNRVKPNQNAFATSASTIIRKENKIQRNLSKALQMLVKKELTKRLQEEIDKFQKQ